MLGLLDISNSYLCKKVRRAFDLNSYQNVMLIDAKLCYASVVVKVKSGQQYLMPLEYLDIR